MWGEDVLSLIYKTNGIHHLSFFFFGTLSSSFLYEDKCRKKTVTANYRCSLLWVDSYCFMYAILKSFCSAWSFFLFYRLISFLFSLWVIPNHLQNANTYMLRHTHIHTQSHTHIVFPPYFWKHTSKKRSLNQNPEQHWDKGHWHNLHTCQSRTRGHSHLSSLVDYVKSSIISNSKKTIFKIVGVYECMLAKKKKDSGSGT